MKACLIRSLNLSLITAGLHILIHIPVSDAQEFGRFFTTPEQRQRIDEIKLLGDSQIRIDDSDIFIEPEETTEDQLVEQDTIHLKGLVYRSGGKNTAWVNESNSFEGGVGNSVLKIDEKDISTENVKIQLPGQGNKINLKVGQNYEPVSGSINEISPGTAAHVPE